MSDINNALRRLSQDVGKCVGQSDWIVVHQHMIDAFADTTNDHQWIHIDPIRASNETPFGGTIAHGFLTLSLASQFAYQVFPDLPGQTMGINYGFNRLRFLSPVKVGASVRGSFLLKSVTPRRNDQLLRETELTIHIKGQEQPALVADWLGLAIFSPPKQGR